MDTREILVKVWQDQCIKVSDFLSFLDRFDFETAVDVLASVNDHLLTVNEAEEVLREKERGKKCKAR